MKKLLPKFIFPLLLFFLVLFLFLANFSKGTYLSGWDNLHPEFNPLMNLKRAWEAAWQEYQGLGLLAGMAHGADLFRQLIFLPMALLLPANLFRYVWHFLMILTGVLSSFYLFKFFLQKTKQTDLLAFLGASFYLLNFGTVQNFYVTFEPFAAFYAFLPLLLLLLIRVLLQSTIKKNDLFLFLLVSVLASCFAYVQTIFVVYFALVGLLFLVYCLQNPLKWKRVLSLISLILLVNSFWLFNVFHFTVTSSDLLADSKGKAMSNDVLRLKNQAFGDFSHLAKLQGFWLGQTDFDQSGNTVYLFDAWKTHFSQPLVTFIAFVFFVLLLLGLWHIFAKKTVGRYYLLSAFLLSTWMMALEVFPFSLLTHVVSSFLPLFDEMFRINFTKWIVPFSLLYSLLVTFGLAGFFALFKKNFFNYLLALIFFVALLFYSTPSFQGHFFYERLRVKIPEAYLDLFSYFKTIPKSNRIANFPQHTFYGWQWNDWGYRGSGFLWYGIEQPILDRAFDVWSEIDERYYWQLQMALDKKDVKMIEQVLEEYDVDYLLLDESLVNRNTVKPFNYSAIESLLASSSRLKLVKNFDFIKLYVFDDKENKRENDFVSLYDSLPVINNSYKQSWSDQAYYNFHDYLFTSNNSAKEAKIIYPFASLFANHAQKDLEFKITEDENFFYFSSLNLKDINLENYILQIKSPLQTESTLPFSLNWTTEKNQLKLTFRLLLPEIYAAKERYYFDFTKEIILNSKTCQQSKDCVLLLNNQQISQFSINGQANIFLNTKLLNTIALGTENKAGYFDYVLFNLSDYELEPKQVKASNIEETIVKIPKLSIYANLLKTDLNKDEAINCRPMDFGSVFKERRIDGNFYQATGTSVCDHFYLDQLKHYSSYLFKLEANNLRSIPFVFAIQAESLGRSPLETYLSEGMNYHILPPIEDFNQGYTLYLSTDSYGREINDNFLKSAEVFAWPYNFLSNLYFQEKGEGNLQSSLSTCDYKVKKKGLWFYEVNVVEGCRANYLKLSQAYDNGWLAFRDQKLLGHEKINNWSNAWVLDGGVSNSPIYIFFWPQLLEYFGLLMIFACFFHLKMR